MKIHTTEGELFTIFKPYVYCFSVSEKLRMNTVVCYGKWFGGIVLFFQRVCNCANCLQISTPVRSTRLNLFLKFCSI